VHRDVAAISFTEFSPIPWIITVSFVFFIIHVEIEISSIAFVDSFVFIEREWSRRVQISIETDKITEAGKSVTFVWEARLETL